MQAIGLIETRGLVAAIESADAMLKAADVKLVERSLVKGGIVTITITGDVAACKASVDAGVAAVERMGGRVLSRHVIPRPHDSLADLIGSGKKPAPIAPQEMPPEEVVSVKIQEVQVTTEEPVPVKMQEMPPEEIVSVKIQEIQVTAEPEEKSPEPEEKESKPNTKKSLRERIDEAAVRNGAGSLERLLQSEKAARLRELVAKEYPNLIEEGRSPTEFTKSEIITKLKAFYGSPDLPAGQSE